MIIRVRQNVDLKILGSINVGHGSLKNDEVNIDICFCKVYLNLLEIWSKMLESGDTRGSKFLSKWRITCSHVKYLVI